MNIMKNLISIFLIVSLSLIQLSCRDDCFTPPEKVVFEFVDSTGVNLISSGVLNESKIVIQQINGNGTIKVKTNIVENNKIGLENVGWYDGTQNYNVILNLDPIRIFKFKVESSKLYGDCTGFKIDNVFIEDINSSHESGYYKIVVD